MQIQYHTKLDGFITMTDDVGHYSMVNNNESFKFIWCQSGEVCLDIDYSPSTINENQIVCLSPYQKIDFKSSKGKCIILSFDSNFYCIYGHDSEVSCNGILFNGSSNVIRLNISDSLSVKLKQTLDMLKEEDSNQDDLKEEMLRILLKRFIVICTRIARCNIDNNADQFKAVEIIRQFYILVDNHFKEKKQVKDYADMLNRTSKTISNLFSKYDLPSPLQIIHLRIESEAKRLLRDTNKSAKDIAYLLGFDDVATFSRFFKKQNGKSISEFRNL
ncbi:MAG: AraC family transcriptional regulator [Bacteroidales bacterium]|nr:AraC family transcriptional regulator [Bacteroidales bacterium]